MYPYAVGDHDLSNNSVTTCCMADVMRANSVLHCTRQAGHDGPHVAHALRHKILAIGPDPTPDYLQVSEGL